MKILKLIIRMMKWRPNLILRKRMKMLWRNRRVIWILSPKKRKRNLKRRQPQRVWPRQILEVEMAKKSSSTKKSPPEKSTKLPAKSEKKTVGSSNKSSTAEASPSSSKAKGSTSKKQKVEEEAEKENPVPVKEKPAKKKQESKSASKEKGKGKPNKVAKKEPTNAELRAQAVNILKEVDFNTATLSDILRLLGSHFGLDLMHRKVEVKAIITDVIENMSDDDDDDDDDDDEDDSDEDAQDSDKE